MQVHELEKSKGLKQKARRKGRGDGSKGNTAGRGNKGQRSRSGSSVKAYFEGGQTPLTLRLPKLKGFKRHPKFIVNYKNINLSQLEKDDRITNEVSKKVLKELKYIKKSDNIKILGEGELTKKLEFVDIDKFSKSAIDKITKVGGKINNNIEQKVEETTQSEVKKEEK